MSIASENFGKLVAQIVHDDKAGVVRFLNSQGIRASANASNPVILKALFQAFQSEKFRSAFSSWADTKYQPKASASGFNPMSTQGGKGEFDPLSSQFGANLNQDKFANMGHMEASASGFEPMDTQSGGFSPMESQFANMGHMEASADGFNPMSTQGGSGEFDPLSSQFGANLNQDKFANMGHTEASASGFDPLSTQGGSGEFDPLSSQFGTNLNDSDFANASGFEVMNTQSGGFTPMSTQSGTNLKEERFVNQTGDATKPNFLQSIFGSKEGGTKVGNFLRSENFKSIFDKGFTLFTTNQTNKQAQAERNGEIELERLRLQALVEANKLTQAQANQKLGDFRGNGGSNTVLYIVLGVVLLGAIGTTIYFATRKK